MGGVMSSGWALDLRLAVDVWGYGFGFRLLVIRSTIVWWSMYYIGSAAEGIVLHYNIL